MRDYQKKALEEVGQRLAVRLDEATGKTMTYHEFNLAQLRHAFHHLDQGRILAGKEVIASVIRSMERSRS